MAIKYYKEAIKHEEENSYIYMRLGLSYLSLKQYDNAINIFNDAIMIFPEDSGRISYHLGRAYEFNKNYDLAIENFKKSLLSSYPAYPTYCELNYKLAKQSPDK